MPKTWKEFLEGKKKMCGDMDHDDTEREEEKLGKDLDGDDEEGESEDHKKKVFGKFFGKKKGEDEGLSKSKK